MANCGRLKMTTNSLTPISLSVGVYGLFVNLVSVVLSSTSRIERWHCVRFQAWALRIWQLPLPVSQNTLGVLELSCKKSIYPPGETLWRGPETPRRLKEPSWASLPVSPSVKQASEWSHIGPSRAAHRPTESHWETLVNVPWSRRTSQLSPAWAADSHSYESE